jgi:hypothetical protein
MCNALVVAVLGGVGVYLLDRAANWWMWRDMRDYWGPRGRDWGQD